MKILLIGNGSEKTFRYLSDRLSDNDRIDFDVLDIGQISDRESLSITSLEDNLTVQFSGQEFVFDEYDGFYSRIVLGESTDADLQRQRHLVSLLVAHLEYTEKVVINRPSAATSNDSKLYQLMELEGVGLNVPATSIYGSAASAKQKMWPNASIISKGCSGVRTRAAAIGEEELFRLQHLTTCPSLFQEQITGPDVRIHVVGDAAVAIEIISSGVDYRYPEKNSAPNTYKIVEPPVDVIVNCYEYCRRQRILFCGIDFKVCKETGKWFVLEANPMPGFDFYDCEVDGAISERIADCFCAPPDWWEPKQTRSLSSQVPFIPDWRRPQTDMG